MASSDEVEEYHCEVYKYNWDETTFIIPLEMSHIVPNSCHAKSCLISLSCTRMEVLLFVQVQTHNSDYASAHRLGLYLSSIKQ